jgi:hypothetical protein
VLDDRYGDLEKRIACLEYMVERPSMISCNWQLAIRPNQPETEDHRSVPRATGRGDDSLDLFTSSEYGACPSRSDAVVTFQELKRRWCIPAPHWKASQGKEAGIGRRSGNAPCKGFWHQLPNN